MKKFLRITALVLIGLIILLYFLLGTQAGLRSSIYIASKVIPGELNIASARGSILGPLKIDGFTYNHNDTHIHFSYLNFDWRPADLLVGRLSIKKLYLYRLIVKSSSDKSTEQAETSKKEKNDSLLPMALTLDNVYLHDIHINNNIIQYAHIQAYSSGEKLVIKKIKVISHPYDFSTSGYIGTAGKHTTDLNGELINATKNFVPVTLDYHVKGDTQKLNFSLSSKRHFKLNITGTASNILQHGPIDANGSWGNIIWPLSPESFITSDEGKLKLSGTLKKYHLTLNTKLGGSVLPSTNIAMDGSGDWEQFNLNKLQLHLLNGSIDGRANINWDKASIWQLELTGQSLNPAIKWDSWPGSLNFNLSADGSELGTNINLYKLSGQIHNRAINASADLSHNTDGIQIKHIDLKSGNNTLHVQGNLGKQSNLSWNAQLNHLSELIKTAKGSINSKGLITGPAKLPDVDASLNIHNFSFNDVQIQKLLASTDFNSLKPSHFKMTGSQIKFQNQYIYTMLINASGDFDSHQINMNINGKTGDLILNLNGQYKHDQWHGTVSRWDYLSKQFSNWHLQEPIHIKVNPGIKVSNFCWQSKNGSLCADLNLMHKSHWKLLLKTHHLNLAMLHNYLPEGLSLNTNINTDINFDKQAGSHPEGHANIDIASAAIHYKTGKQTQSVNLQNTTLSMKLNKDGLYNKLVLNDTKHQFPLVLRVNLPKFDAQTIPNLATPIQAELKANWKTLSFLNGVVPDAQNINGQLNANMKMTGSIEKPVFNGNIDLINGQVDLKQLGLTPRHININLSGQNNSILNLKSSLRSGNQLNITGKIDLAIKTFLNSLLNIKGDHILVTNSPEYKVSVSPDLKINYKKPKLNISGTITIPDAQIKPKDFSSAESLPDNVIVVGGDDDDEASAIQPYIDVRVKLDKANIQYAGLDADIAGDVTINSSPQELATGVGNLKVTKGAYKAYNQALLIKDGTLLFTGGPIDNPGINILAVKTVQVDTPGVALQSDGSSNLTVGVHVTGTMDNPKINLYSSPTMSNANTLSYLVFGQGSDNLSDSNAEMLSQAAASMGVGGEGMTGNIKQGLGLTEFGFQSSQVIDPTTQSTEQNTSFVVGKKLTRRLSISYSMGILVPVNILRIRYMISKRWALQSDASTYGNGADIFYTIETD